jgi:hypothetical protein
MYFAYSTTTALISPGVMTNDVAAQAAQAVAASAVFGAFALATCSGGLEVFLAR